MGGCDQIGQCRVVAAFLVGLAWRGMAYAGASVAGPDRDSFLDGPNAFWIGAWIGIANIIKIYQVLSTQRSGRLVRL